MEKLLKVEDVAEILQIKSRAVIEMLKDGRIKGVKPGGKMWRICKEDLQNYINTLRGLDEKENDGNEKNNDM